MKKYCSSRQSRERSNGFTLVELLVVISIIAVLVAILLPSLNKARQAAQDVQCLSNMRQIGIALVAYQNDYHGVFPVNLAAITGNSRDCWDFELAPYLGLHAPEGTPAAVDVAPILRCPRDWRSGDRLWDRARSYAGIKVSEARPNDGVFWAGKGTTAPPKVSSIRRPSTTVIMTEWQVGFDQPGNGNQVWSFPYCQVDGWLGTSGPQGAGEASYHGGRIDFLFADGHAKLCDPREAWSSIPHWWTR